MLIKPNMINPKLTSKLTIQNTVQLKVPVKLKKKKLKPTSKLYKRSEPCITKKASFNNISFNINQGILQLVYLTNTKAQKRLHFNKNYALNDKSKDTII